MHYTLEQLIAGDQEIVGHYAKAGERWKEILASKDANTVESLAKRLSSEQLRFEHECGGRWLGQEIMAIVGIAQFYDTTDGFGGNVKTAKRVYDAFRASYCSIEVKGHADTVARSYQLLDELELEDDA